MQNQPFLDDTAYPSYLRCGSLRVKRVVAVAKEKETRRLLLCLNEINLMF